MSDPAILQASDQPAEASRVVPNATVRSVLGLVTGAVIFVASWPLWYLLLHPNGVLKLYTPMYGFSLVALLVGVLVAMTRVAECWPLHASSLSRPARGVLLTTGAVALTAFVVYGIFWGFIGRFGITYFSPRAIIAAGGVGAEYYNARENASTALLYFTTSWLWIALALDAGFARWPWGEASPGTRAFSRITLTTLLAIVAYVTLFHPHITQLFYPAQTFAGVPPWWASAAQTTSAYFNLGWVLTAIAVLVASEVLWDGWPWRSNGREGGPFRGTFAIIASTASSLALFAVALRVMNSAWGEAFQGGQYTDAPYFRHLHAGEVAGFFVLSAFALDTWFERPRTTIGRVLWTVLALVATVLLHIFYYSAAATRLLGKVPGIAQPEDSPLVWTLLVLALVLVQRELFDRWPLRRRESAA
jgi:AAT family amino acid transporter